MRIIIFTTMRNSVAQIVECLGRHSYMLQAKWVLRGSGRVYAASQVWLHASHACCMPFVVAYITYMLQAK